MVEKNNYFILPLSSQNLEEEIFFKENDDLIGYIQIYDKPPTSSRNVTYTLD